MLHDFSLFNAEFQKKMRNLARGLLKKDAIPRFIFNELLGFCNDSRMRIVTDHLITFMNSRVVKYHQEAVAEAHKLLIADEASTDARIAKAAELIK